MATKTISQYTAATTAAEADEFLLEAGGNTRKITGANLGALVAKKHSTWTPALKGSTTAGSHTPTTNTGHYIKFGDNLVIAWFRLEINPTDSEGDMDTAMAGNLTISGLPVSSTATGTMIFPAAFAFVKGIDFDTGYTQLIGHVQSNGTEIVLQQLGDDVDALNLDIGNLNGGAALTANTQFVIAGTLAYEPST